MEKEHTMNAVVCCFCGQPLPEQESVLLVAYPEKLREESQSLYAHKQCLRLALDRSIPLHPDLRAEGASLSG
jgi:hypothetical protein